VSYPHAVIPRIARTARVALAALAGLAALATSACDDGRPRALVLADGAGPGLAPWVDERANAFERAGRSVRVLRVGADDAINLASRGDADVALVPSEVTIDRFLSAQHGREAGRRNDGLRVLVVDARTHPKVDREGADKLAQHLLD
jgi:ABC-type tungstate transport system permease subunit